MPKLEDLLTQPLQDADIRQEPLQAVLRNVQGNILNSHGRKFARHIFLRFQRGQQVKADVKQWIRTRIATRNGRWPVTSALKQLAEARAYHELRIPGDLFVNFLLSASGYHFLEKPTTGFSAEFGNDTQEGGMKEARGRLHDPSPTSWEEDYRHEVDAMILLADDKEENVRQAAQAVVNDLRPLTHIWVENGYVKRNKRGQSEEHFGYVDSLSQPLFFQKDLDREKAEGDGIDQWHPGAGPHLVLTRDPLGGEVDYGSYLVFRKLQQHVGAFKAEIRKLAKALNVDKEKARALVMGRFRDGTPLVLHDTPQVLHDPRHIIPNNFRYAQDFNGQQCPFHAHIRRMNPRWTPGNRQYDRRIARRGMLYGPQESDASVGLLFMCYQSNLKTQFEALQGDWAQAPHDLPKTGYDALIGQAASPQQWPFAGGAAGKAVSVGGFVTLRGGEYFFAPSINVLKNL